MKINFKIIFKSKEFWENVAYVIFAVLLFFGLRFTIGSYYINQTSMEPNYVPNERLLFNKLAYKFGAPQRGDIIYFHPSIPSTSPFIKRIIGLPGEQIDTAAREMGGRVDPAFRRKVGDDLGMSWRLNHQCKRRHSRRRHGQ